MTQTGKKKVATYTPVHTTTEYADNVLADELFASTRPGSARSCVWVPEQMVGMYKGLKYAPHEVVNPDDVVELSGGATRPSDTSTADFGVFVKVVDERNRVVLGSPPHVLMWTYKDHVEERQKQLSAQAASTRPQRRGKPGEELDTVNESIMTLDELRGKG